jgi:iron complex outermembrane receptor protein
LGVSIVALTSGLAWAGIAQAQTTPLPAAAQADTVPGQSLDPEASDVPVDEADIVVTGTLLRGVAPTGTNVVSVTRDDVLASGAASSNDLLASIPQVGNFGTVPVGSASFAIPVVRPNIRNLGASGGVTTLVLVNGHRMVGAGVLQTTFDPSAIPPDIIERVEVVPDGGSAIYGSDAIGGVINFITRKRFNGVGASARYSFGDDYQGVDGNLTVGRDWGTGSLFVSYAYAWHDNILGIDRDYVTADNRAKGGTDFRTTTCAPGTITAANVSYALPGLLPNTSNLCDSNDYADIYPRERRNSVYAGLTQRLSDSVTFDMSAYWSRRDTTTLSSQSGFTGNIIFTNPYFRPIGVSPVQGVALSFADVFGKSATSKARFDSYGVTPSIAIGLGGNWQLRAMANFGESYNLVREQTINSTAATVALAGTTTATALNPYNLSATNPAVLASIADFENFGDATQALAEGRLILDGSLASLPGGDIRLAVGAEYHYEQLDSRIAQDRRNVFTNAITSAANRDVKSAYAELLIPIFGAGNGGPGMRSLQVSGSVRHDDYSDVGGTTNPKVGVTYKPFEDFTLRGNYGTSFHAASLADTTSTADSRVQVFLFSPYRAANSSPLDILRPMIVIAGGNPDLRPEKADTWSVGFDWVPKAVPGLVASATYWNVKFTDSISVPPITSPVLYSDPNYASYYILSPTLAQAQAAAGSLIVTGAPSLASLYAGGATPYVLFNARRTNLGSVHTDGIDFNVAYTHDTGFGSINANVAGTYTLNRKSSAVAGGPFSDNLKNGVGRTAIVAGVGARVGDLTGRATLNYRGGYPILGIPSQADVSSFKTVDLFFSYDLGGLLKNSLLTLNVDNLFDQDPPYLNSASGYTNGSTLGRVVSVGVRTKF